MILFGQRCTVVVKVKKKKKNSKDEVDEVDENKKIDDFEPLGIEMVPVKTERAQARNKPLDRFSFFPSFFFKIETER